MPDPKTYKQHFEVSSYKDTDLILYLIVLYLFNFSLQSKHPKSPMPEELVDVEA